MLKDFSKEMTQIQEGKAILDIETASIVSKDLPVFFNPKMERNRSISVALLETLEQKDLQIALPLAGSGVRAVRFAKELEKSSIRTLAVNDMDPQATAKINEMLTLNNLANEKKITVTTSDAEKFLLNSTGFDYIDIDPFGSPNFLLDAAIKRLSRKGILAVTATDTGALAGSFVNAGKMKYWAVNTPNAQKHELGMRILARKVMLVAMQHAKALVPILSYREEHYYRIFFQVTKGRTAAAELFDKTTGQIQYCKHCGNYELTKESTCSYCAKQTQELGPCYTGALQGELVAKLVKKFPRFESLFSLHLQEQSCQQIGGFDMHELAKKHQKQLIKIEELCTKLKQKGFSAVQSAWNRTGIKTSASLREVLNSW